MSEPSSLAYFELTEFGVQVCTSDQGDVHVGAGRDGFGRCVYLLQIGSDGILDVLAVGLRSASLREFRERAKQRVFQWRTADGALLAAGAAGAWTLQFAGWVRPMSGLGTPRAVRAKVHLNRQQSDLVRSVLFTSRLPDLVNVELQEMLASVPPELVGDRAEALKELPGLAQAASFWNEFGVQLGMTGHTDSSSECFQRARTIQPDWDEPTLNLAENARIGGRLQEALALIESAHASVPRYSAIKGNVLRGLGRAEEAARCFEDEVERNPDFKYAYQCLIDVLEATGSDRIEYWIRRAIFRFPGSPEITARYCRYFFNARDFQGVVDAPGISELREEPGEPGVTAGLPLGQAIKLVATYRSAAFALLTMDAGDVGRAVIALDASAGIPGRCSPAHALLELCAATGAADGVSRAHGALCPECAARLDAEEVWAARASSKAGEHARALERCEAALLRRPSDAVARWQQWWTLDDLGRPNDALKLARRMWDHRAEWSPKYPTLEAHLPYNLGLLCGEVGRHAEAVDWYRRAIQAMPGQYQQRENLAVELLLDGQLDEAHTAWTEGHSLRKAAFGLDIEATEWPDGTPLPQRSFDRLTEFARLRLGSLTYALDVARYKAELDPPIGSDIRIGDRAFTLGEMLALSGHGVEDTAEARRYGAMLAVGDYSQLVVRLEHEIGGWSGLPPAAQSALLEAERRVVEATPRDYAPEVVAFAKAVEITLYQRIFVTFRSAWRLSGMPIAPPEEDREKVERFARFLERGHALELGSMVFCMGLATGRTRARNPFLAEFARSTVALGYESILSQAWRTDCEKLASKYRNRAVHSEALTRPEALEARALAIVGLRALVGPAASTVPEGVL